MIEKYQTILLVKDQADPSVSCKKDLESLGYRVVTVYTGEEAVETAGKTPGIDLILMDIDLGDGMDGAQAAEQILEKHDLPLVFMLSKPDPETLEKVERITSYGFVTRNSSIAEVNSSIKMAFRLFESKKSEKEVRDQLREESDLLRFYRLSVDALHNHKIAVLDREYRYKIVSRQYMISYDLPEEEILGKTVAELMGADAFDEFLKPKIDSCLEGNHIQYSEWFNFPGTGKRYMEVSYYPLSFEDQEVSTVAVVVNDITERKRVEDELLKSLKEKNVLLSEIHHRVKNNMAIVSSLLALQSEFDEQNNNPEILLKDLQTRILSMALVHELVYESKNHAEISCDELLQRLANYLESIYRPYDKEISMQVRSDDIMLDMNKSVPLTLLMTEVITNAWKHAFTGRQTGCIEVIMEKSETGSRLVIRDDGVGVSDLDKINNPKSFGYTIVHGLVGQLRGELAFYSPSEGGLKVEAWFPDKTTI